MTQRTVKKLALWLLWLGAIVYAFAFAPPNQPHTFDLIKRLAIGQFEGINPLIVALFYIQGIWPVIYSGLMVFDGRMQKVWAWPFLVASFVAGAFVILPYLALREPNAAFAGPKNLLLRTLDSRWLGGAIVLGSVFLSLYGLTQGDWTDFIAQWQTSRFINVMSFDFCLFWLLFPTLLGDDMSRRHMDNPSLFGFVSLVPLLGAALYLVVRSPLQPQAKSAQTPDASIAINS